MVESILVESHHIAIFGAGLLSGMGIVTLLLALHETEVLWRVRRE